MLAISGAPRSDPAQLRPRQAKTGRNWPRHNFGIHGRKNGARLQLCIKFLSTGNQIKAALEKKSADRKVFCAPKPRRVLSLENMNWVGLHS